MEHAHDGAERGRSAKTVCAMSGNWDCNPIAWHFQALHGPARRRRPAEYRGTPPQSPEKAVVGWALRFTRCESCDWEDLPKGVEPDWDKVPDWLRPEAE